MTIQVPKLTLTKRFEFEATHYLPVNDNKRYSTEHKHNFWLDITLEPVTELRNGMILDVAHFQIDMQPILNDLNDKRLNDIYGLEYPTLENITVWLWKRLGFMSNGNRFKMVKLRLYEDEHFWCEVEI